MCRPSLPRPLWIPVIWQSVASCLHASCTAGQYMTDSEGSCNATEKHCRLICNKFIWSLTARIANVWCSNIVTRPRNFTAVTALEVKKQLHWQHFRAAYWSA